jgi:hypothetical protein
MLLDLIGLLVLPACNKARSSVARGFVHKPETDLDLQVTNRFSFTGYL